MIATKPRIRWNHKRRVWKCGRTFYVVACPSCRGMAKANSKTFVCTNCASPSRKRELMVSRASWLVRKAVLRGDLPHVSEYDCVDCGRPAEVYDHRDYDKPLEVAPVCKSCNNLRGPAVQEDGLKRPPRRRIRSAA